MDDSIQQPQRNYLRRISSGFFPNTVKSKPNNANRKRSSNTFINILPSLFNKQKVTPNALGNLNREELIEKILSGDYDYQMLNSLGDIILESHSKSTTGLFVGALLKELSAMSNPDLNYDDKLKLASLHTELWIRLGISAEVYHLERSKSLFAEYIKSSANPNAIVLLEYTIVLMYSGDSRTASTVIDNMIKSPVNQQEMANYYFYAGAIAKSLQSYESSNSFFFQSIKAGLPKLFSEYEMMVIILTNLSIESTPRSEIAESINENVSPLNKSLEMVRQYLLRNGHICENDEQEDWISDRKVWLQIADKCVIHRMYLLATDFYSLAMMHDPDAFKNGKLWYRFAKACYRCGKTFDAQLTLKQALAKDPCNAQLLRAQSYWGDKVGLSVFKPSSPSNKLKPASKTSSFPSFQILLSGDIQSIINILPTTRSKEEKMKRFQAIAKGALERSNLRTGLGQRRDINTKLRTQSGIMIGSSPYVLSIRTGWVGTINLVKLYDVTNDAIQTIRIFPPFTPMKESIRSNPRKLKLFIEFFEGDISINQTTNRLIIRFVDCDNQDYMYRSYSVFIDSMLKSPFPFEMLDETNEMLSLVAIEADNHHSMYLVSQMQSIFIKTMIKHDKLFDHMRLFKLEEDILANNADTLFDMDNCDLKSITWTDRGSASLRSSSEYSESLMNQSLSDFGSNSFTEKQLIRSGSADSVHERSDSITVTNVKSITLLRHCFCWNNRYYMLRLRNSNHQTKCLIRSISSDYEIMFLMPREYFDRSIRPKNIVRTLTRVIESSNSLSHCLANEFNNNHSNSNIGGNEHVIEYAILLTKRCYVKFDYALKRATVIMIDINNFAILGCGFELFTNEELLSDDMIPINDEISVDEPVERHFDQENNDDKRFIIEVNDTKAMGQYNSNSIGLLVDDIISDAILSAVNKMTINISEESAKSDTNDIIKDVERHVHLIKNNKDVVVSIVEDATSSAIGNINVIITNKNDNITLVPNFSLRDFAVSLMDNVTSSVQFDLSKRFNQPHNSNADENYDRHDEVSSSTAIEITINNDQNKQLLHSNKPSNIIVNIPSLHDFAVRMVDDITSTVQTTIIQLANNYNNNNNNNNNNNSFSQSYILNSNDNQTSINVAFVSGNNNNVDHNSPSISFQANEKSTINEKSAQVTRMVADIISYGLQSVATSAINYHNSHNSSHQPINELKDVSCLRNNYDSHEPTNRLVEKADIDRIPGIAEGSLTSFIDTSSPEWIALMVGSAITTSIHNILNQSNRPNSIQGILVSSNNQNSNNLNSNFTLKVSAHNSEYMTKDFEVIKASAEGLVSFALKEATLLLQSKSSVHSSMDLLDIITFDPLIVDNSFDDLNELLDNAIHGDSEVIYDNAVTGNEYDNIDRKMSYATVDSSLFSIISSQSTSYSADKSLAVTKPILSPADSELMTYENDNNTTCNDDEFEQMNDNNNIKSLDASNSLFDLLNGLKQELNDGLMKIQQTNISPQRSVPLKESNNVQNLPNISIVDPVDKDDVKIGSQSVHENLANAVQNNDGVDQSSLHHSDAIHTIPVNDNDDQVARVAHHDIIKDSYEYDNNQNQNVEEVLLTDRSLLDSNQIAHVNHNDDYFNQIDQMDDTDNNILDETHVNYYPTNNISNTFPLSYNDDNDTASLDTNDDLENFIYEDVDDLDDYNMMSKDSTSAPKGIFEEAALIIFASSDAENELSLDFPQKKHAKKRTQSAFDKSTSANHKQYVVNRINSATIQSRTQNNNNNRSKFSPIITSNVKPGSTNRLITPSYYNGNNNENEVLPYAFQTAQELVQELKFRPPSSNVLLNNHQRVPSPIRPWTSMAHTTRYHINLDYSNKKDNINIINNNNDNNINNNIDNNDNRIDQSLENNQKARASSTRRELNSSSIQHVSMSSTHDREMLYQDVLQAAHKIGVAREQLLKYFNFWREKIYDYVLHSESLLSLKKKISLFLKLKSSSMSLTVYEVICGLAVCDGKVNQLIADISADHSFGLELEIICSYLSIPMIMMRAFMQKENKNNTTNNNNNNNNKMQSHALKVYMNEIAQMIPFNNATKSLNADKELNEQSFTILKTKSAEQSFLDINKWSPDFMFSDKGIRDSGLSKESRRQSDPSNVREEMTSATAFDSNDDNHGITRPIIAVSKSAPILSYHPDILIENLRRKKKTNDISN
eukprot:gene10380-13944_t